MRIVYSAPHLTLVSLFKDILQNHGIKKCWIENEFLMGAAGELPPIECWPKLCVEDDKFIFASQIIEEALISKPEEDKIWRCNFCGEENDWDFKECWNCGKIYLDFLNEITFE